MSQMYFSSMLMWNASLDQIFSMAYENGFDGIELWAEQFSARGYSIDEYRKLSSLYPVKTFVHSYSKDLNLAALNIGMLEASIQETKKGIDLTNALGAYELTVHPGQRSLPVDPEGYYQRLYYALEQICCYAKDKFVDVSLEIMEKDGKNFIVSPEEMIKLTGPLFDKFYYTLDVAHCNGEKEVFDALNGMKRISKIHISNRIGNHLHTPLFEGDYSFHELIPKLQCYNLPMVVEGFDADTQFTLLRKNIEFLKTLED